MASGHVSKGGNVKCEILVWKSFCQFSECNGMILLPGLGHWRRPRSWKLKWGKEKLKKPTCAGLQVNFLGEWSDKHHLYEDDEPLTATPAWLTERVVQTLLFAIGPLHRGTVDCAESITVVSHKVGICRVSPDGKPCRTVFTKISFNGHSSLLRCEYNAGHVNFDFTCLDCSTTAPFHPQTRLCHYILSMCSLVHH